MTGRSSRTCGVVLGGGGRRQLAGGLKVAAYQAGDDYPCGGAPAPQLAVEDERAVGPRLPDVAEELREVALLGGFRAQEYL